MSKMARTIVFHGRVQGVGFRMTAVQLAEDLPLAGTVRNVDDDGVELVVAGEPADIDKLVLRLREHFGSFIRTVEQHSCAAPGFKDHGIRVTY